MKLKSCRNCNHSKLTLLFTLGNIAFTGKFPERERWMSHKTAEDSTSAREREREREKTRERHTHTERERTEQNRTEQKETLHRARPLERCFYDVVGDR